MTVPAMAVHMEKHYYGEPNVIIILGGTNDIVRHLPGAAVGAGVVGIHEEAKRLMRAHGVEKPHTVAVTIPNTHQISSDEERSIANKAIRRYVEENPSSTLLFEMEDIWPVSSRTKGEDYEAMWSPPITGQLHFSLAGYEAMGHGLYEIMEHGLINKLN
jgi:lysophospholipase L1-like esterase